MKKIFYRSLIVLFLTILSLIVYLSLVGIETKRFNNQIEKKISNLSNGINVELKEVKLVLDLINFQFNSKTLGPKIRSNDQTLEIESIKTQISLKSIFKDSFPLKNLDISTKSIEIKKLISFIRSIERDPKLLILENFIKKGHIIADIKLKFDKTGNINNNYKINGFVKNGKMINKPSTEWFSEKVDSTATPIIGKKNSLGGLFAVLLSFIVIPVIVFFPFNRVCAPG